MLPLAMLIVCLMTDNHTAAVGNSNRLAVATGWRSTGAGPRWTDCGLPADTTSRHSHSAAAADSDHPDTESWYADRGLLGH